MKVFSLDKFKASKIGEELKQAALTIGWPQKYDGKNEQECKAMGLLSFSDTWAVEQEEWEASRNKDTATIKGSKLEYHLLPPEQLAGMAEIMNHGVKTHVTGYMDLDPLLYWNATMRHLMALRRGELTDEEGNSHALAIACNGVILDRQLKAGKELRFE